MREVGGGSFHMRDFNTLVFGLHHLVQKKRRIHKLEYVGANGDYDQYRVIYD